MHCFQGRGNQRQCPQNGEMTFAYDEVESGKVSVSVHSAPQSDLSTQGPQDVLPGAVIRVSDESAVTPGATISPPDEVCSAWHSADWAGAGAQKEQLSFFLSSENIPYDD